MDKVITDDQVSSRSFHVNSHACECDVCTGNLVLHNPEDEYCDVLFFASNGYCLCEVGDM